MLKLRLLAGIGVLATVAIAPPAAASATSSVKLFQNPARTADCGIKIDPAHKPGSEVLCSRAGVPRPKHGGPAGDPFVQLGASGPPQLVLISQDSFVSNTVHTLAKGTLWHSIGVTCNIGTNTIALVVPAADCDGRAVVRRESEEAVMRRRADWVERTGVPAGGVRGPERALSQRRDQGTCPRRAAACWRGNIRALNVHART